MKTITFSYPDHGDFVVTVDDEGNIINKQWSNQTMDTGTIHNEQDYSKDVQPSAEDLILSQYETSKQKVERIEKTMSGLASELREAKAERARLHKLAVVIDPRLKRPVNRKDES